MTEHNQSSVEIIASLEKKLHAMEVSESRLIAENALLSELCERMPLGYQSLDENGCVVAVNQTWVDTMGYSQDEVIGRNFSEFLHSDLRNHLKKNVPRFEAISEILGIEFELVKKNGSPVLVYFHGKIGKDPAGHFQQIHCVFLDIIQRRQAEDTLHESELRMLAEAMPQIVWITRPDGRNIYFNQKWVDYTGMTLEESYGHGWAVPFHPDDQQRAWDAWQNATTNGAIYSLECRLRRADGEYKWWLIRGVPLLDADKKVLKWIGTCTDIDHLKKAEEEALLESESCFRTMVDAMPQLAWIARSDGHIFWYNQRWYDYTGTVAEQMEGWGWQSVHDPKVLAQVLEKWQASIATGKPFDMVFPLRGNDGVFRLFLTRVMPLCDLDGKVIRWFGTNTDITEREQAEAALRQSEERYHSLFKLMLEGFCIIEVLFDLDECPIDYRFLEINPAFEKQTGLHNVQGKLMRELAPENEEHWFEIYGNVALTGESVRFESEAKALNRWYDVSAYRIGGRDSRRVAILFNDITEAKCAEAAQIKLNEELEMRVSARTHELATIIKKLQFEMLDRQKAEESVQRLNRLHAVLTETSHAIVRTKERETLFNDFCRIAVENGSFKLAWVGLVDEESGELKVVASAGATGYLADLRITINEEPAGLGPTGISIRDGSYYICNDFLGSPITLPWHERGRAHNIRASASIALRQEERVVGALTIYSDQKDFFDQQHVELLRQMGADISFALDLIVREACRKEVEQNLREETVERQRAEAKVRILNAELEQRVIERTVQLEAANRELEAFSYSVSHDLRAPLRAIDGFSQALLERYHDLLDEKGGDYLRRVRNASQKMAQLIDDLLKLSRLTRGSMNIIQVDLSHLAWDVAADLKKSQGERRVSFLITEGLVVQCDPQLLKVVLNNLLGNAWKFTGNKEEATIEFGSTLIDGMQTYFIRDNGAGFDMAYSDKLFATFQRLHLERDFPGTGIGLSLVQRIIHRHGGKVWAEGKIDEGAIFYFTLNPIKGTEA